MGTPRKTGECVCIMCIYIYAYYVYVNNIYIIWCFLSCPAYILLWVIGRKIWSLKSMAGGEDGCKV